MSRLVMCNGCFDVFHPGHAAHLKEARAMGDSLVVALTLDEHVNKGPGRPIYKWDDRASLLRDLRYVDGVVPSVNSIDAIRRYRPSIFVKGIDYADGSMWTEDIQSLCKELGVILAFTRSPKQSASETISKVYGLTRTH